MFALDLPLRDGQVSCVSARLQLVLLLVKGKVETLLWLARRNRVRWEDRQATARSVLRVSIATCLFFFHALKFLFYIGGCRYLRHFATFVLNLSVALGARLRP